MLSFLLEHSKITEKPIATMTYSNGSLSGNTGSHPLFDMFLALSPAYLLDFFILTLACSGR